MPGYITNFDALQGGKGVDEIWCLSVNDAFVMGAWAREQKAGGKIRMMADGSAEFDEEAGLSSTCRARHGRAQQALLDAGEGWKVATLNVEAPGKFEVSNAETLLAQARD